MLDSFFILGPSPPNEMIGNYNPILVALSYLVAVFASYIALDLTGRLRDPSNSSFSTLLWLVGGSIAMGAGIWSMHFIGMLSFSMPGMVLNYELFWTSLSLFVAIIASAFALVLLKTKKLTLLQFAIGGIIIGLGIASMHYTGMEGMRIQTDLRYIPSLFLLSILIAIIASEAALWLALKSNQVILKLRIKLKIISAIIMGVAICGMHYTGMLAAVFTPTMHPKPSIVSLDPTLLSMSIAAVTFIILGIAFFASTYKEASNQHQLEKARQLGMAEVSASVLHNVGNVLNSLNVTANIVSDKVSQTKLKSLSDLNKLIKENQHHLAEFIANDPRGTNIPEFIDKITELHQQEQTYILDEMKNLTNNIQLIKDIISTQQTLSKVESMEQIVLIDQVVDEALLITDFNFARHNIKVIKNYKRLHSILIDKVKFLQILVNIFQNARDALIAANKAEKHLIISTNLIKPTRFCVKIEDNGIGINKQDLKKLFIYGFTTKPTGHGFGLHTSILIARNMSGDIKVESKGVNKGAVFTLEMPYVLPKA